MASCPDVAETGVAQIPRAIGHEDAGGDCAVGTDAGGGGARAAAFVVLLLFGWKQQGDMAVMAMDLHPPGVARAQFKHIMSEVASWAGASIKLRVPRPVGIY